jgi:hypothetical protein
MSGRIGERTDGLQVREHLTWPAMGDDDGHGVRMLRANVNEVDTLDLGDELWEGIELRLGLPPVVVRAQCSTSGLSFASWMPCD